MSVSLKDGEIPKSAFGPNSPIGSWHAVDRTDYEADIARVDASKDPDRGLREAIASSAPIKMTVRARAYDNAIETFELDRDETRAFLEADPHEREQYQNVRILERRRRVVVDAIARLRSAPGFDPAHVDVVKLKPHEEAYARDFGVLIDHVALKESAPGAGDAVVVQQLREYDDFFGAGGSYEAPLGLYARRTSLDNEYTPRGSPALQQLFINDVWDMQAKAWWAWHHDPIAKKAIGILTTFVLGRGISVTADDPVVQAAIDAWWKSENMARRLKGWTTSLSVNGEVFIRDLDKGGGARAFRKLPSETIVEIIADAEDSEAELAFIQRYQTRTQQFGATSYPQAISRFVYREIPAFEVIHVKVNASEEEIRGRSDALAALPWLKRLRDYFDSLVQKAQAAAAYQWDYEIDGGLADIQRFLAALPGGKPDAGSYFAHNKGAQIKAVTPSVKESGGDGDPTYDALVIHIANAFGLNPGYFGVGSKGGRATALVGSEPDAKVFEDRQDAVADMLTQVIDRMLRGLRMAGKLTPANVKKGYGYRLGFPAIVKSDAQTRQTMIDRAESMGHISKKTAAQMVYGELDADGVVFEDEQTQIAAEAKQPNFVISIDLAQVPKGVAPGGGAAAASSSGAGAPKPGAEHAPPEDDEMNTDAGDMSPSSMAGAGKIRNELGREGGRRASIRMYRDGRPEVVLRA